METREIFALGVLVMGALVIFVAYLPDIIDSLSETRIAREPHLVWKQLKVRLNRLRKLAITLLTSWKHIEKVTPKPTLILAKPAGEPPPQGSGNTQESGNRLTEIISEGVPDD